jgi:ribosome-associated protein
MPDGSAALDPDPQAADADSLPLARRIAALIRERRGSDLVLLDVRRLVDYTDFFLLASGQSARQNQAIAEHVVRTLKSDRRYAISKSGLDTGSWICLDMGDVVVHVFDPETRARYDLELLWADAPRVETEPPAAVPAAGPAGAPVAEAPAKRRRVVRKAAVEGADAGNAPDSERPAEDEAPDDVPAPRPAAKRPVRAPAKKRAEPSAAGPGKRRSARGDGVAERKTARAKSPKRKRAT